MLVVRRMVNDLWIPTRIEGVPLALAYTASKHAVVGMTKAAALEWAPAAIRVTSRMSCNGPCAAPPFNDVPAASPFCPWIQELAHRGITGGCGGGNFCPTAPNTRGQMAVFLTKTFGLLLYGP